MRVPALALACYQRLLVVGISLIATIETDGANIVYAFVCVTLAVDASC